jgi:hypothetical protein
MHWLNWTREWKAQTNQKANSKVPLESGPLWDLRLPSRYFWRLNYSGKRSCVTGSVVPDVSGNYSDLIHKIKAKDSSKRRELLAHRQCFRCHKTKSKKLVEKYITGFKARSQNYEKWMLALSCLSVRAHGTTRLPLDEFWWNLMFRFFFFLNLSRKFKIR